MKRHSSLAHLSRDHHGALLLARLLQKNAPPYKGLPTGITEKAAYAKEFYKDELVKHFTSEEKALHLVTGINKQLDELVQEIFNEHQQLHLLFSLIPNNNKLDDQLDEIGKALETHVRKEERVLFPLIEQSCSEAILQAIEQVLVTNTV